MTTHLQRLVVAAAAPRPTCCGSLSATARSKLLLAVFVVGGLLVPVVQTSRTSQVDERHAASHAAVEVSSSTASLLSTTMKTNTNSSSQSSSTQFHPHRNVTAFSLSDITARPRSLLAFSDFNALLMVRASVARYPHSRGAAGFNNTWFGASYNTSNRDVVNVDPCTQWNGVGCEDGRVTEIKLHNMNLDGTLPNFMPDALPMLKTLMFTNNKLKGTIPSSFGYLTSLQNLYLNLNILSGSLPTELGRLTSLQKMSLDGGYTNAQRVYGNPDYYGAPGSRFGNQFTGSIPSEIGQLKHLTYLNLHRNFLQGTLPWAMGELRSLQIADLSGNNFTGPLRGGLFANLKNARELLFDDNHFTGTLPPELQRASSLEVLVVEGNNLSGPLPEHLPPRATFVDFHTNAFTGTVPAAWATNAPMVNVILLHDNMLHGSIPKELAQLASLHSVSFALNEEMCGEDPGLPMPKLSFLKNECDKVFEMCALWPETRGTRLYSPCDLKSYSDSLPADDNNAPLTKTTNQPLSIDRLSSWRRPTSPSQNVPQGRGVPRPLPPSTCAKTWEQCGGAEWNGASSCCTVDTICVSIDEFYSHCVPTTQACGAQWGQCGGRNWKGVACCRPDLTCVSLSPWYSHCQPRR